MDHVAISISLDGVWAGSGKLRNGTIEDCGAQFCDDSNESLLIYDKIEQAITADRTELNVSIEGKPHCITWVINGEEDA